MLDRPGVAAVTLLVAAAFAAAFAGCGEDAREDLDEGCTAGPCGSATLAATSAASTSTGGATCAFDDTGELPCDVFGILNGRCHKCHQDPPLNGAPFSLLTWAAFQEPYGSTPVWDHAAKVVEPGAIPQMPFLEDPLPEEQLVVLRAWFDTCRAGACEKAQDGGAGTGGAGGNGTAGTGGAGSGGAGGI